MSVRVICGINEGRYPVAGRSIAEVRKGLRDAFNFSTEHVAEVNGRRCEDKEVLQKGDTLELIKEFGHKGGIQDFVSENEIRQLFGDDGFERLRKAGLKSSMQPVFRFEQVLEFQGLVAQNGTTPKPLPITVNPDEETLTYKGRTFECERSVALVLKCLIDAGGEIRSTSDIRNTFSTEPLEDRLDLTIKRKLIPHHSGVGDLVESVQTRGFRFRVEDCE